MNLKELIGNFVDHRRDVVIRRTKYDLKKAEERAHILEGLIIASDNIDEVIAIIKKSGNPQEAISHLMARLASRVADFYERAGRVICNGFEEKEGALTVIGAVSPPGGDISEPVSQATLRIVKVFWGLDYALSYARHFPAINWLNSYSLYQSKMDAYFDEHVSEKFSKNRIRAMSLLQEESGLQEIVRLVGRDALSEADQLKLEVTKSIREDFLQQNAFHEIDTYCSLEKQMRMLDLILYFYDKAKAALDSKIYLNEVLALSVRERIARSKNIPEDQLQEFNLIFAALDEEVKDLMKKGGVDHA